MTVLLTLSVNMMMITNFIPETSRNFPRLCNYFLGSIVLCAGGVVLVCIIDRAASIIPSLEQTGPTLEFNTGGQANDSDDAMEATSSRQGKGLHHGRFSKVKQMSLGLLKLVYRYDLVIGLLYLLSTLISLCFAFFG